MGLLRRLADRLDPPETRAMGAEVAAILGGQLTHGQVVNARTVENLATVMACVNAVSGAIGSLPAYVYRRSESGRDVDDAHPVTRLIHEGPNQWQSWSDWCEWTLASVLLRGNALNEVRRDGAGRPVAMVPIPWENVSVQLLPSGRLAFDVVAITGLYGGTGRLRRLLQDEVFYLKDRSDDALVGRSRLSRAAEVLSVGLQLQEFSNSVFENGVFPSGAVEVPGSLGGEAYEQFKLRWKEAFGGPSNAAKALVLDSGMTWKSVSISPEDAETMAARRFSTEEIARLFGVPPPIIQDYTHNTFTNSQQAALWFAQHTLQPWIMKIEREFARSVFSAAARRTHTLEIDLSGFMRGDPETRWQSHEVAVKNGILTPNEVREVEGWNPREDGDRLAVSIGGAQVQAR